MPVPPAQACRASDQGATPGVLQTGRHTGAIMLGTSAALALYGKQQWWRDGFRSHFTSVNEGWFGADTYSGGTDKLGHFYMTYASARLLTQAIACDGAPHARALQIAAWYTLGAFAAIEVLDGFSRKWAFGREDMLMNAAGVGAAVLFERYPGLDRRFDLRLLYRPSKEDGQRFDPFGDYAGQTYLVAAKLAGFPAFAHAGWLRYVELSAGYGTRGFTGERGRSGARHLYLGVSVNLSELLNRTATAEGPARRLAGTLLEYVQVPGTVALARRPLAPEPGGSF